MGSRQHRVIFNLSHIGKAFRAADFASHRIHDIDPAARKRAGDLIFAVLKARETLKNIRNAFLNIAGLCISAHFKVFKHGHMQKYSSALGNVRQTL